jgi:hypothetical protein
MSERAYLDKNGSRSLTSRRGFLTGSAAALGGGVLMTVHGAVFAKGNGDDEDNKQGGKANNSGLTDVDILNYALVLERLEYEFYRRHLQRFSEQKIEGPTSSTGLATWFAAKSTRTSFASATTRRRTCRPSSRS